VASDQEVESKRKEVEKLREQVSSAQTEAERNAREKSNDISLAQLETEEARLQTELLRAREAGKKSNLNAGMSQTLDTAKEQQKAAEQQASALKEGDK
jgi:hypothetical protein